MWFRHNIAENVTEPNPVLEPFILKQPKSAYFYAKQVLKKPWEDAEEIILEDPEYSYLYAKNLLKKRWEQAEQRMLELADDQDLYGTYGRQKARETLALYAKHVIKGRWKEAESFIAQSSNLGDYADRLSSEDLVEFKNMVTLNAIGSDKHAKRFFSWKPTHSVKMKGAKAFDIMLDAATTDRWGRPPETRYAKKSPMFFKRAHTLKEWLKDSDCSIELCNDRWYWKRQLNYFDWGANEMSRLAEHELKGTVTPLD